MKRFIRLLVLIIAIIFLFCSAACNDGKSDGNVKKDPYSLTGTNVFDNGFYILADFETYMETVQPFYGFSIGKISMVKDKEYVTRGEQAIKVEIRGTERWAGNVPPFICFLTSGQYFQKKVFSDCDYLAIDMYNPTEKEITVRFQINGWQNPTETIVLKAGKNDVRIDITSSVYLPELNNVTEIFFIFDRGEQHDYSEVVCIDNFRAHKIAA